MKILRNPFRKDRLLGEIDGSPIPPGADLLRCGMCMCAVARPDFTDHCALWHPAVQYTSIEAVEKLMK